MNLYCDHYTKECKDTPCAWKTPEGVKKWCDRHRYGDASEGIEAMCDNTFKVGETRIGVKLVSGSEHFKNMLKQAVRKGKGGKNENK